MKRLTPFLVMHTAMALVVGTSSRVTAQDFQGGIHFLLASPRGDFEENVDRLGYGLSGQFGFAPQASPLMIGLEFGYLVYGEETRQEPFSTTIPDVIVDVSTTNNILLSHLLLRLQPNAGVFRPYLEGFVGLSYLFTRTEIQDRDSFDDEEVASSTNFDDVASSYGAAGGAMLRVFETSSGERQRPVEVLIDFRLRYLIGGEAEYLKEGSIGRENGNVTYDVNKSTTDLLTYQLGVVARF